jgi:PEP-CTERM motif
MRLFRFLAMIVAMFAALPASAALFLSGDSNIFGASGTPFTGLAANQSFLLNIAGNNVLIQDTTADSLTVQVPVVSTYLTSQSITNTVIGSAATLTAADFVGRTLFIGYAPVNNYTAGELALMSAFLGRGGSILLTGENSNPVFTGVNAAVNAALAGLGSGMALVPDTIDAGFNTATVLVANAFTAGTTGFQYAATSRVTGGTGLYATVSGRQTFLAVEGAATPAVPEPASWALMLLGFGIVGGALRRRSASLALI